MSGPGGLAGRRDVTPPGMLTAKKEGHHHARTTHVQPGQNGTTHHRLRLLRAPGDTACDDCVVTFLLGREPDDAVVIDADAGRAMRMLEQAGLVPSLRFSNRAG